MEKERKKIDISKYKNKKETFTELYSLIWKELYEFALYTLKNPQEAEDAVHDAITIAYNKFEDLRNKDSFKPWIFKILSNCCKKRIKNIIKNKKSSSIDDISEPIFYEDNSKETMESIYIFNLMKNLKEDESMILNMSVWAGYKSTEIAKILNLSEGTVRSKIHRTLRKLRSIIEE